MISILPILATVIFSFIFLTVKWIKKQSYATLIRNITVSSICVLYSLHPTITRMVSSLFFCMELDKGQQWLREDLEILCWDGQHLHWSIAIGLPSILVWIVGVPIIGFIYLFRNRLDLYEPVIFGRYRMVYQGLKAQYFYWEFINILRKIFLVSINVFLNLYPSIFKDLVSLMVVTLLLRL